MKKKNNNYYMQEEFSVNTLSQNEFINALLLTKNNFFGRIKFYFFLRRMDNMVLDYDRLKRIAISLKLLECISFFPNKYTNEFKIMTKSNKNEGVIISFMPTDYFEVIIKLNTDDDNNNIISINVLNKTTSIITTSISFIDGQYKIKTIEERELFINIIKNLIKEFSKVLKYYFYRRF